MRSALYAVLGLGLLIGVPCDAAAQGADLIRTIGGKQYVFKDYSYNNARGSNHSFLARLFVPADYDPSKSYPLVMFLHGDGEAGNNNTSQINSNINNLVVNAENRDVLLYVPQSPGTYWNDTLFNPSLANISRAAQEYNVDLSRIYVTGLSKGGAGTQQLMSHPAYNDVFGAYVPLSVANATSLDAQQAAGLPAWYFHGRQDSNNGRSAVSSLVVAQGGSPPSWPAKSDPSDLYYAYGSVQFTEYATAGHDNNVWNNGAYNTPAMYEWMLSQTSRLPELRPQQRVAVNFAGNDLLTTVDATGATWNSLGKYGVERTLLTSLGFAKDADGKPTPISIGVSKAFDNAATTVPTGVTAFDDPAVAGKYWRTLHNQSAELTFMGLIPHQAYIIEIFASTTDANVVGLYSVGDVSDTLNATGNLDQFAVLSHVPASADGTITLTIAPTGGSTRAVINTLTIAMVPEPTTLGAMLVMSCGLLRRRRIA